MKKIIISLVVALATLNAAALDLIHGATSIVTNATDINVRLGYAIGGTMPMGMPASIRGLNSYTLQFNPSLGIDVTHHLKGDWYIMAGLQLENKGMEEDAQVKNYHMEITRGGQTLAGMFTGDVTTKVTEWMLTIPVQMAFKYKNCYFKVGPYLSYVGNKDFSGWAHNGYLRVDDPTGAKVEMGEAKDERGDYDFTSNMRRLQVGIDAGVDWHFSNRFGAFADLTWGLNRIQKSDFKTIEQNMYPVFAKFGLTYRLK